MGQQGNRRSGDIDGRWALRTELFVPNKSAVFPRSLGSSRPHPAPVRDAIISFSGRSGTVQCGTQEGREKPVSGLRVPSASHIMATLAGWLYGVGPNFAHNCLAWISETAKRFGDYICLLDI